jgi:hypothetical protein
MNIDELPRFDNEPQPAVWIIWQRLLRPGDANPAVDYLLYERAPRTSTIEA